MRNILANGIVLRVLKNGNTLQQIKVPQNAIYMAYVENDKGKEVLTPVVNLTDNYVPIKVMNGEDK